MIPARNQRFQTARAVSGMATSIAMPSAVAVKLMCW